MPPKIKLLFSLMVLFFLLFQGVVPALESGKFRLLSISDSEKLILVSQIPSKKKFLLDASSVKITSNDKALEFKELKLYSIIQIQMELVKKAKNGISLDGVATEIKIPDLESIR